MYGPTDHVIQATNDDATNSKAHAVKRGYWTDPYMKFMAPLPQQKSPEINRGYFARTQAFRAVAVSFIKQYSGNCQVVNLGAGSDTLFFNLNDESILPEKFVEIDLMDNVMRKVKIIQNRELLKNFKALDDSPSSGDAISPFTPGHTTSTSIPAAIPTAEVMSHQETCFSAGPYYLFPFDLRRSPDELMIKLCGQTAKKTGPCLDPNVPTLFLAECVLVYMPPDYSLRMLRAISGTFHKAAFLHYEQTNMNDRFGAVMIENFRARSCNLPGLSACQSLEHQEKRFLDVGWKTAKAWTVNEVYQSFSHSTRSRIEEVEMLDDVQIAQQLFDHYCILLAQTNESVITWSQLEEPLSRIP